MSKSRQRAEFLKDLGRFAAEFRQKIEAEVEGFAPDPAARQKRRDAASAMMREGFEFFARTYFPHYIKHDNSLLHEFLYTRLPAILQAGKGQADAIAAPRGEAKSTIVSQIFVLWCAINDFKKYICIIMDAFDQAAIMLEAIKVELESNQRLAMDFEEACGVGRVWQAAVICTKNGIKIEAFGSGKKIRGRRHGPYRPDLVVLDDIENDENVANPSQRDKLEHWLDKSVMKLGGAGAKLDVIFIGTVLHYDSVLARKLKNPFWRKRSFKAILQFPDDMDAWGRWEEIVRNIDLPLIREAEENDQEIREEELPSYRFYQENRAAMDAGAIISWPAGRPLFDLMWIRARDGHAAFDSEYQNCPLSAEGAPFAGCITFWVNRLSSWIFYGACDPSLGRHGGSRDPSAILVGGFDKSKSVLDVVEASIKKRLPDKIIEDIIALQSEYRCAVWGVESVQFQEFLRTELLKRSAQQGIPVPARAIIPHTDKVLRIESLQPHVAHGQIRLHSSQQVLIEQLRHFPKADHDDGPDALHMLWMLAISGNKRLFHKIKLPWL